MVCVAEGKRNEGKLSGSTVILATENEVVKHPLYKENPISEKI